MAFDLGAFLQRELANQNSAPSKRVTKNRSGRAGRRAHNGQQRLAAVGGFRSDMKAIYAPEGAELCVVVPMETGFRNGKPFRL